jgi:uncharacterized protein YecE (DUF72 family)
MDVRVGVSGWRYPHWRGGFYPPKLRQKDELAYAASKLDTVEINGSFYSLQTPTSYARWRDETPDGFVFAVKGSRFITHMKKLANVEVPLANFLASGVLALGPKLGPILWQLPARFPRNLERLAAFFRLLPRDTRAAAEQAAGHDVRVEGRSFAGYDEVRPVRYALEVRHPDLVVPEALALYREHHVALVCADTAGIWPLHVEPTTDFAYVRLHGATELYASGYTASELDTWAERIRAWNVTHAFVYFDNDARGHAPNDAAALRERLSP